MKSCKPFARRSRVLICSAVLLISASQPALLAASPNQQPKQPAVHRSSPSFIFYDDEFWLNLHHFLYVLGRAENKTRDSGRAAVSGAPADQQQGLTLLTAKEQALWLEAVSEYAAGLSRKDLVFDDPLPAITIGLARARATKSLSGAGIDPAIVAVLAKAAPIYRKAWWPNHRAANKAWRIEIEALVKRYGATVLGFISKVYRLEWAAAGYGVHLSAYANWAGAYSTTGNLLVVSSLNKDTKGVYGLETVFHEGMHQWDDFVDADLQEQARRINKSVPRGLSHGLIFFTAGEAVRRVVPEHIPYADKFGVWQRRPAGERDALVEIWQPYLNGQGTRDEAFAALIKRL